MQPSMPPSFRSPRAVGSYVPQYGSPAGGYPQYAPGGGYVPAPGGYYGPSPQMQYYQSQRQQQQQQQQEQQQQQQQPHEADKRQALTIASLQNQLLSTTKDVSQAAEQLMHTNIENQQLKKVNAELQERLQATRNALCETRDSLEQVQTVIKPLTLAQRAKEQQLQQLSAMNRLYEAKIEDYETKIRQAEATIQRHIQMNAASAGDEALIEKLHERLINSQNALVKCQSDLQRLQVATASSNAELVEAKRNVSALEVQLLVQKQSNQQALQVQRDQAAARENSLFVELSASKRRLASLEEQVQLQLSYRAAERKEEQIQAQAALAEEIRLAMNKITGLEERRGGGGGGGAGAGAGSGREMDSPGHRSPSSPPLSSSLPGMFASYPNDSPSKSSPQSSVSLRTLGKTFSFFGSSKKAAEESGGVAQPQRMTIDVGGGAHIRADQVVDMDAEDEELGSPASGSGSNVNMPILFRPIGDITEEVKRLEAEKDRTVKGIKEWTDVFVKANKREPSAEDISRSAAAKALYDEMDEISTDLKKNAKEMSKTIEQLSKLQSK